jgi:hypothetical protein
MKTFIKNRVLDLVSASLLLVASEAKAEMITSSAVFPGATTEWSHNFVLPLFDPSLGSLQSVYMMASESVDINGMVQNNATGPESFTIRVGSMLTVNLPGTLGVLQPSPLAMAQLYNLPSGGSSPYGPVNASDSVNYSYTSPADMNWFVGVGTFTLPAFTQTQELIAGGGGNARAVVSTRAGATVEVQYTYQPVPEATTFCDVALLLLLPFGASVLRSLIRLKTA